MQRKLDLIEKNFLTITKFSLGKQIMYDGLKYCLQARPH